MSVEPRVPQLFWENVRVGDVVTAVHLAISYTRVVMNAATSRDYMRGHHDPQFAQAQGRPNIFMNTLFHQAFIDRVMCDWAGPAAFIARRKITMRESICAGDTIVGDGQVTGVRKDSDGRHLIDLELAIRNQRGLCCSAQGTVVLPSRAEPL